MRSIQVSNRNRRLHCPGTEVRRLFRFLDEVLEVERIPDGELSIVFLDRAEMCKLHEDYLMDATHTDVITFPGDPEMDFAGEICVSADFALENAAQYGQTFARELSLYLIHGWLHLAGFDDRAEEARAEMRKGEARLMDIVEKGNMFPAFHYDA